MSDTAATAAIAGFSAIFGAVIALVGSNLTYIGPRGRKRKALVEEVEIWQKLPEDLPSFGLFREHLDRAVSGYVDSYYREGVAAEGNGQDPSATSS